MKGGPVIFFFFDFTVGQEMIHALLTVRRVGFGGCNPKNKRKGSHRKAYAFSEESMLFTAHSNNSPGCRVSCGVQKGPGSL